MHITRIRRFGAVSFWHVALFSGVIATLLYSALTVRAATPMPFELPALQNGFVTTDQCSVELAKKFTPAIGLKSPFTLSIATTSSCIASDSSELTASVAAEAVAEVPPTATPKPNGVKKKTVEATMVAAQASVSATPEPTKAPVVAVPVAAPADLEALFSQHAATHGVDPEIMKKIAQCESGMRPNATNGPYGGMFQFVSSTWVSNRKAMGKDTDPALRFNASEAIETAAFKMGRDGYGAWPSCSRKALNQVAQI